MIDEDENMIDTLPFREVHDKGLLHRFCRVLLMNSNGYFILHTRSKSITDASKLDAPGGHLDAGFSYEEAAVQEVYEEMGVKVEQNDLTFIGKIEDRDNKLYENMIGSVYIAIHDGPYIIEDEEVDEVYAISENKLTSIIKENPSLLSSKLKSSFKLWQKYNENKVEKNA